MSEINRSRRLPAFLLGLFMVIFLSQAQAGAAWAEREHRFAAAVAVPPEPPRVFLDTTYSPPAGNTITVNAGGDLQAALNAAQPGDIVVLQAGATFTGNFVLPNKGAGSDDWIYVQTSAYSSLPPPGSRISPADAANMPTIMSPNLAPAIATQAGAHHYRFVGIRITTTHATRPNTNTGLVVLGTGQETSVSQLPHHLTFDRNHIFGTPTGNIRRGITANAASLAVIDSRIEEIHEAGADSQAICGWNSPGPFKIVNNYLSGSGENVMFGGARVNIMNAVPSDIEFRRNYLFKPLAWKQADSPWTVKNLFELKNAQRVLVEGNVLENNWAQAQNGFGVLLTPRGEGTINAWTVVQDIIFSRNILRNSDSGFNMSGRDDLADSQQTKRVLIRDNVIEGVAPSVVDDGPFRLFQLINGNPDFPGSADFTITNNTSIDIRNQIFVFDGEPTNTNFVFTNNLVNRGQFGVFGSGFGEGTPALERYTPGYEFRRNVIVGADPDGYPPDNFFPPTLDDVGFADWRGGDYRLVPPSPYIGQGTDGNDPGADIAAVNTATRGVTTGR
jgi:hypothetical protein